LKGSEEKPAACACGLLFGLRRQCGFRFSFEDVGPKIVPRSLASFITYPDFLLSFRRFSDFLVYGCAQAQSMLDIDFTDEHLPKTPVAEMVYEPHAQHD
jgi:hypothetical protein